MTDIVTRLQAMCQGHTHSVSIPCPIAEAVEEIKTLRRERDNAQRDAAFMADSREFWRDLAREYGAVARYA